MPENFSFGSKKGVLTVADVEGALISESRVPDEDGVAGEELSSNQVSATCNKKSWKRRLFVTFSF